jgi:arginyl-tRNA synthetase
MLFNPSESIDFNGNTGPFIQYTYARIRSIMRKAGDLKIVENTNLELHAKEKEIIKWIYDFPQVIQQAASSYSPALIANYVYELVKLYNSFYHDFPILKEEEIAKRNFRIELSSSTAFVIKSSMNMLGIEVPERM